MSTTTISRSAVPAGTWTIDPAHSKVGFAVKHMGIATVRGEFTDFAGTLEIGEDLSSARAYGTVQARSVDTSEAQRDEHLRSPDFFDVARYPELRFESTKIEALDDEEFRITGRLTIHGVTNEIVLHAEVQGTDVDPWGNERVGLEVTGQLSRGEYDMKFNQALGSGNMLVADKVKLALDISAVKQSS
jgi:polyisoprenoid-binding protein YceI